MDSNLTKGSSAASEQAVIGCIMLDETCIYAAREILAPDDFFYSLNKKIYTEMLALSDAGQKINIASLISRLIFDNEFSQNDGVGILTNSINLIPSASFVETYARKVKTESTRRKLSLFADGIKDLTSRPIEDVSSLISSLSDKLFELNDFDVHTPWKTFGETMAISCENMIDTTGDEVIKSGFVDLDGKLSGFRPGALTIIAARPAMGKTAFGINILTNAIVGQNIPVAFFSLEMTSEELMNRVLSNLASVDGNSIRQKTLTNEEWVRVLDIAEKYSKLKAYIDETPAIDISLLRDRTKRMYKQYGVKLMIVDYLQLMHSDKKRIQNREQEVADISRGLKSIAKELHIPVIALAQLNRAVDARAEKRPVLSDLRESGSIEQDADNILFIHREDYYRPNAEQNHEAEIIIAKQRSGPTGVIKLRWTGEYTRFETLDNRF